MELLVIGIDGGDKEIFEHMDMPFFNSLLEKGKYLKVEEDLWSRGWANILSGKHGLETGAFYAKPVLNSNSYISTQSFRSTNYKERSEFKPVWELLNERGYKVGLMNFPTTAPTPQKMNGFMVTGAGGGISQKGIGSAPEIACFPDQIKEFLDENEYIFDIRFRASGIRKMSTLIDYLIKMHTKRVDNFLELHNRYQVDIGGVAFMSTTRIQYLAMYEIERFLNSNEYSSTTLKQIKKLYTSLDKNLERFIKAINPKEILFVADHGAEPRKGTININAFLNEKGYLKYDNLFVKNYKRFANRFLGGKYGLKIKKDKTKAFAHRYISGLYINDEKRFGGPISEENMYQLVDEIVESFNNYPTAKENKLSARPYRRNFKDAFKYDLLPDVWVDRPDSLFFEAKGDFVEENKEYGPLGESLEHVSRDQYTGTKGRYPLFVCSSRLSNFIKDSDPRDLTLAYKIIDRYTDQM